MGAGKREFALLADARSSMIKIKSFKRPTQQPLHLHMSQIAGVEQYTSNTLKDRWEILEKLRLMEKLKTLVTAQCKGTSTSFLTTIVRVIPEKDLLAFEPSMNAHVNSAFANAGGASFTALVEGIQTRFSSDKIIVATLNDQPVLAVPIPESLYWRQRRRYYRQPVPYSLSMDCHLPLAGDKTARFPVIDLGLAGLAFLDKTGRCDAEIEVDQNIVDCQLDLPPQQHQRVILQVRYKLVIPGTEGRRDSLRVGCELSGTSRAFAMQLQKFVYELERQKKKRAANLAKS